MKPIFFRSVFLLSGALLQVSLVNTMFSSLVIAPPILLAGVIATTLFRGFSPSWQWAVVAGVLLDSLTLGRIGMTALEYVLAAALLSFTAKELVLSYHMGRVLFFGGLLWLFEVVVCFAEIISFSLTSDQTMPLSLFFAQMHWAMFFASLPVSVAVCALLFPLTFSFERYLDLFEHTKVGRR